MYRHPEGRSELIEQNHCGRGHRRRQRLDARLNFFHRPDGMAEESSRRTDRRRKKRTSGAEAYGFAAVYGTTEVVPFPRSRSNQRFPAASRAVIRLNTRKCLIPVRLGNVPAELPVVRTFSAQHESK
jgi:hypothetical protein